MEDVVKFAQAVEGHLMWEEQHVMPTLPPWPSAWMHQQHSLIRASNYDAELVLKHSQQEERLLAAYFPKMIEGGNNIVDIEALSAEVHLDHGQLKELAMKEGLL
jgi:hypothetical protein